MGELKPVSYFLRLRMRSELGRHSPVFTANVHKLGTFQLMQITKLPMCDIKICIAFAFSESMDRALIVIVRCRPFDLLG